MTISDILIIYFAIGAPFSVLYFIQNRKKAVSLNLLSYSMFIFLFWMPFAWNCFIKFYFNVKKPIMETAASDLLEQRIKMIQSQIESLFRTGSSNISFFEFREILERYCGLSLAVKESSYENLKANRELFSVSKSNDTEISALCLNRRNRLRLSFHHNLARKDFIEVIEKIATSETLKLELKKFVFELMTVLDDYKAQEAFISQSEFISQTRKQFIVKHSEKETWKPDAHKHMPAKQISTQV